MATYGLRDHECFFANLHWVEKLNKKEKELILCCKVTDGKTGEREVFPFYPDWVIRWKLWEVNKPKLTVKLHKDYGDRTSKAFKRSRIPFTPYDLRHAYAIRAAVVFNVPVGVAAAYMGHSPEVHLGTYNRWISSVQHQQVYEDAVTRPDRPMAP